MYVHCCQPVYVPRSRIHAAERLGSHPGLLALDHKPQAGRERPFVQSCSRVLPRLVVFGHNAAHLVIAQAVRIGGQPHGFKMALDHGVEPI